ncbi:hypothetical protein GGS26DRAFT_542497 [Hypomontagnella submonticulosa]|nr:hypothetical protein GGS26DRAFT_542497 [Hypomontagnella submonticulosa]
MHLRPQSATNPRNRRYFLSHHAWDEAAECLLRHESTTRHSLKRFVDTVPKRVFPKVPLRNGERLDGPLALEMLGNLQLLLEETLLLDPDALKKTKERLSLIYSFSTHTSKHWNSLGVIATNGIFQKHLIFQSFTM